MDYVYDFSILNPPGCAVHFPTFNIVQNALQHQCINIIYFYKNSAECTVFDHCFLVTVLANYINFVPVNISTLLNGPCYVEIEVRSGIH